MRNSCEDVGEHRIARAADGLERLGLVAHHLHLDSADRRRARDDDGARHAARVEVFGRLRLAVVARGVDRAAWCRRDAAVDVARLQHVAANLPISRVRRFAEHPRRLWVEVSDAAIGVDCVDALDDALEDRLRLRLTVAERRREIHEVPAHVFHGARERLDLLRALRRDGR